ncbi:gp53-like domain-containing protein, partial [Enterobacter asburiae]|uniref:gp53-like domain-containing protein n=6 Tax=Enterobacter TaxID=547 RepID=UPI0039C85CB2
LGLGTAAQRNVGTGANQIPDMNSFTSQKSLTGWQKLPGGMILQWGLTTTFGSEQNTLVTFPVAFPGSILMEYTTYANTSGDPATGSTYIGQIRTTSNTQMYVRNLGPTNAQYNWLVIGY